MQIEGKELNWIGLSPDGELQVFLHKPKFDDELNTWVIDETQNEEEGFYVILELGYCEHKKTTGLYNVEGDNPYLYDDMPADVWQYVKGEVNGKN